MFSVSTGYEIDFANQVFRSRFGEPAGRPCYEILCGALHPCTDCPVKNPSGPLGPAMRRWTGSDGVTYQSQALAVDGEKNETSRLWFVVSEVSPAEPGTVSPEAAGLNGIPSSVRVKEPTDKISPSKKGSTRRLLSHTFAGESRPEGGRAREHCKGICESAGEAEREVRDTELLLESVLRHLPLPVFVKDAEELRFVMVNPAVAELVGHDSADFIGKTDYDFIPGEQADEFTSRDRQVLDSQEMVRIEEEPIRLPSGETRILRTKKVAMVDDMGRARYLLGISEDITEEIGARNRLRASLEKRDVLLREIHHRVKNNLAVIVSLLGLQIQHSVNKPLEEVLEDLQSRVRSMATAHDLLYRSEDVSSLSASDYLGNLIDNMWRAQVTMGREIAIEQSIDEIGFGLDTAIPLGMLVVELISNCLKHAFPEDRSGTVRVLFRSLDDDTVELTVADDGVGLPAHIDLRIPETMGLDLVDTFVQQLAGTMEVFREGGTAFVIRFPLTNAVSSKVEP